MSDYYEVKLQATNVSICHDDELELEYLKQKMLAEFQEFVSSLTVDTAHFDIKPHQITRFSTLNIEGENK